MTAVEHCRDCQSYHPGGRCGHNPEKPCPACKQPIGWLWRDDAGEVVRCGRCWFCAHGKPRPTPRPKYVSPPPEWWEDP